MSNYKANIRADGTGDYYAMIVRVDHDGSEQVIHGYKGRYFKTRKAAERSTANHMNKNGM